MTAETTALPGPDDIILVAAEGDTWLLQGEDHAHAMLADEGHFPTPVYCIEFPARHSLTHFLDQHDGDLLDLWAINPSVISRLQNTGALHAVQVSRA